jgi:hypothetical protein
MKNHFLLVMILLVASLSLASPALAQNQTDTDALENADLDNCEEPEAIDAVTVLCSAEIDGEYAELVLKSDINQRVTLTDAGAFMEPGPINRQTFRLREEEEKNTVRIRITQVDGFAGVSVDTGRVLYAVPIEQDSELIGPPWGPTDAQMAALGGSSSVAAITVLLAFRRLSGSSDSPERVA